MLLSIYLNDHLAGATLGRELSRRAAGSNRGSSYGPFLENLAREVHEDRETLLEVMRTLDVGVDRLKVAGAWGAEKLGRLKPNGRLTGYSPLSRVVELEGLTLGVRGKLAMWRALELVQSEHPALHGFDFAALAARAERQQEGLEEQRRAACAEAFRAES
ncbi:MAG TPA: hypothetical protein VGI87_12905 [Solirubrobacteraceae bacterium]|jgi:hypothetical protein